MYNNHIIIKDKKVIIFLLSRSSELRSWSSRILSCSCLSLFYCLSCKNLPISLSSLQIALLLHRCCFLRSICLALIFLRLCCYRRMLSWILVMTSSVFAFTNSKNLKRPFFLAHLNTVNSFYPLFYLFSGSSKTFWVNSEIHN